MNYMMMKNTTPYGCIFLLTSTSFEFWWRIVSSAIIPHIFIMHTIINKGYLHLIILYSQSSLYLQILQHWHHILFSKIINNNAYLYISIYLKGNFAKKSKIDIMSILYRNAQIHRY